MKNQIQQAQDQPYASSNWQRKPDRKAHCNEFDNANSNGPAYCVTNNQANDNN
jgi:hypothetical protein